MCVASVGDSQSSLPQHGARGNLHERDKSPFTSLPHHAVYDRVSFISFWSHSESISKQPPIFRNFKGRHFGILIT